MPAYAIVLIVAVMIGIAGFVISLLSENFSWFALASVLVVILVLISAGLYSNASPSTISNNECISFGYVEAIYRGGSWYCVRYGNEPQIVKLESENK